MTLEWVCSVDYKYAISKLCCEQLIKLNWLITGPFDIGGQCETCQQSVLHCPGHFGRIDLMLPVINPLFSKTLLQICRMTCLGCREINIPGKVLTHRVVPYYWRKSFR